MSHYREFLFFDDGDLCVAGYDDAHVTRPFRVNGETVFDTSFKAFRVQRRGETHTTITIFSMDDRFLGTYSDATMPWQGVTSTGGGSFETSVDDLYLDHFIFPDGRRFVLDLGEMFEGLLRATISARESELAFATVDWIEQEAAQGRYPEPLPAGLRLNPELLRNLPHAQE